MTAVHVQIDSQISMRNLCIARFYYFNSRGIGLFRFSRTIAFICVAAVSVPGLMSVNSAKAQTICIGGICINGGPTRTRSTAPSQPRWSSSFVSDRQFASNGKGLTVTYDDSAQLILHVGIVTPFPNMTPKTRVPVSIVIGGSSFPVTGVVNETATTLIIAGTTVIPILGKLKTGNSVKVTFLGNDFTVRLGGSRDAIEQVEMGARQWAMLRKDKIDDARKEAAETDIEERPKKKVDTLTVADDANKGIRPTSKLRAGDRKVSDLRVQYYVPGTRDIGEMWVNWDVDDAGLYVGLNFIDPTHKYETKAHAIRMPFQKDMPACEQDLNVEPEILTIDCKFTRSLIKAHQWQTTLEDKKYRKPVTKLIDYIVGDEGANKYFSVVFKRYEDGGYAVQLDDSKFGVSKLFNFTIANALDLARITQDAVTEAGHGTLSEEELDDILQ